MELAPMEPPVYSKDPQWSIGSGGASGKTEDRSNKICHSSLLICVNKLSIREVKMRFAETHCMANTYSRIYLQFVFAVKYRHCLVPAAHKEDVHRYISGLIGRRHTKLLAIHCMPDHIHIFAGYKPVIAIPDLVKEIKVESNQFINTQKWMTQKFAWQEGYGVFSYGHSQIGDVIRYVQNQEQHHQKTGFRKEYISLLEKFEIPFENKYLFDFFDS